VAAFGRHEEQQLAERAVQLMTVVARGAHRHSSGWSGRALAMRDFLRRNNTRLLPSV